MSHLHQSSIELPVWPATFGGPNSSGKIKTFADDFIVEEQLSFHAEGSGEHVFLQIEKCGENTEYVARLLARLSGVRQRDVSYAGLKDRHARTTQWFSVWLPGKDEPDWKLVETETIKILKAVRHARKLKRGVLSGNKFQILIRDWQGDRVGLVRQLEQIKDWGIPNYFGLQRFGYQGQNVNKAMAFFKGAKVKREQRSIYLSSARSFLFNQQLAKRVFEGNWNQPVPGDCFVFDQSNSYFKMDQPDESVRERVMSGEIHPTGMMFGKGESETTAQTLGMERRIINEYQVLADGLIKHGLTNGRRALRVFVSNLHWEFQQDSKLWLCFSLPAGSYATSVLRELVDIT